MDIPQVRRDLLKQQQFNSPPRQVQDRLTIFLFLLPSFIVFLLFIIYPIFRAGYFSLFNWNGLGPATDFVGLNNFKQILTDQVFIKGVENCLLIVVLSLAIQLPLALTLAIMVGRDLPGRAFFRTIFFMPYIISEVITAIIWMSLFSPDPDRGFINALLILIPGVQPQNFLGDMGQVMGCVFVVLTWKYFGLHMLLYMAGLQNIPREIEEAAMIDGANRWQTIRNVIIPLLGSTIRTTVQLSVLGSLTQFNLVWIMTTGGPANASEVMATYMYRYAFIRFQLGYGSAVALVMLAICLIFSVLFLRLARQPDYLGSM
ncbi:MAG TPA: sugar ABC transporter permease [Anaerolineaceae bacterium]|nr:sugar ABC transporter permease [Anaerolineaceae bacterium]